MTLANGFQKQYSSGQGSGIDNAGTLNLDSVVLSDNGAQGLMTAVPQGGFSSVPGTLPPGGDAFGEAHLQCRHAECQR